MRPTVVVIASDDDVHAQVVRSVLRRDFDTNAIVLNTADYPRGWRLNHWIEGRESSYSVVSSGSRLDGRAIAGVWWRRSYAPVVDGRVAEPRVREFCREESKIALRGWLQVLGRRVVNPVVADLAASDKGAQLDAAARVGIAIPPTLISNDPEEVRAFVSREKDVVFKVFRGPRWCFAETRRLEAEHLPQLEALRHAPVIFQRLVEGKDIRATVVDGRVFAVEVRPTHPGALLDWRLDLASEVVPHEMPEAASIRVAAVVGSLGLRYGACDLRLTDGGEYVFLEVNPGGQYLFAEIHAGAQISRAIATALVEGPAAGC